MAIEKGRKNLPPAFQGLMGLKNLSAPFFLQVTDSTQKVVDGAAERMQQNYLMGKRFSSELRAGNGFSPDVISWNFTNLTGIRMPNNNPSSMSGSQALFARASAGVHLGQTSTSKSRPDQEPGILFDDSQSADGLFYGWKLEGESVLQKMIGQASKDPDACLLGGGLPPTSLISEFFENVYLGALEKMKTWSLEEKVEVLQYPKAGGALRHRAVVIDHFLNSNERETITKNYGHDNRAEGLFFTNGSQEALSMMIEMLTGQEKATPDNPVELAITDPTYPGLLMAADKFIQQGLIKFRIIPIDEKTGEIDTKALNSALESKRCKAFYLAEGNPIPKQIANLKEVAKVFQNPDFKDKLVFDDHAYDGLGATEENSLFDLLPNQVVSFKTLSKKAAPFRVGFVYSNMTSDRFQYIRETMLKNQYDSKLGFSGILSGTVAAILQLDAENNVFRNHIEKAQTYYETQRQLYEATYKQALDLAFGEKGYKLDDEVSIGKKMFMFGWRNTHHVPADLYARAGTEIKLYSLSGSSGSPKPENIVGDASSDSPTLHHLRQNYTWIKPENLQLGIFKDVLLEVVFSNMSAEEKQGAVEKLYRKLIEINKNKDLLEVGKFIQKVSANNWQYAE